MRPIATAGIVAVGSELLTPFRRDTNSSWLTGRLNEFGIEVVSRAIAPDDVVRLSDAIRAVLERADLVVLTGGLGPTADDLTREALAAVSGLTMATDEGVLDAIRDRFNRRGVPMPAVNARQALVPEGAEVLTNTNGTAPGLWLEAGGRWFLALPGPPRELMPIFDREVAPRLERLAAGRRLRRRVIAVAGMAESRVEELAHPVYAPLAGGAVPIATSILASPGRIELHLSAAGPDVAALDAALDAGVARLSAAIGPAVYSTDGRALEEVVADLLRHTGRSMAAAESCTGGLLMGRLTSVPGSSAWLVGGVVAYDNRIKVEALGVSESVIAAHGAVSEPVAQAMATGVKARFGTSTGIAITGIAGPSGGTAEKPVGTVVIALDAARVDVRTFRFAGDRAMVRELSVMAALEMVRRALE